MTTPRYVAVDRLSWEPPLFVVIDADTGSVVSKHVQEDIAKATAEAMNHSRS